MRPELLTVSWTMLLARGVVGILLGLMAMVWPKPTAVVLVVLLGVWALVDGIGLLGQGLRPHVQGRGWLLVLGGLAVVAGILCVFRPGLAAATLTWVLGIWLVVRGMVELVAAFSSTLAQPRWLLVLSGVLSVVLGVLLGANPGEGAVVLAFWLGLTTFVWGAAFVVLAVVVRRGHAHTEVAPGVPGAPA